MKHAASLAGQIRQSVQSIAVLLTFPAVISLVLMLGFFIGYQGMISRMDSVARLKEPVSTQVAEQLFSVTAGRVLFSESQVPEIIAKVNSVLDRLLEDTSGTGHLQLTVARRTMGTMEQYVQQIAEGMRNGAPILEMEEIVDEVRSVSALVDDMLDAFITTEIANAAETGARLRALLIGSSIAEILLLMLALSRTRRASHRLRASVQDSISQMETVVVKIAGGDLTQRLPAMNVEELQNLAVQINRMANQLDALIAQIRVEQANLAKAELRTLQAQINPHFLYNTLDTIIWQAESGKEEEVIRLTRTLSDFFRISLSAGADWIPVSQEIRHVESYLSIQKTRYRDILRYSIDMPESVGNVMMVKFLLQPLVENALYHGIKGKRGGGQIHIAVKPEGESLCFSVQDDGKGMTEKELQEVRAMLAAETPTLRAALEPGSSGFGLRNVDMRLRLYYQQETGVWIESDGRGTCVSFRVPVKTGEEIANSR